MSRLYPWLAFSVALSAGTPLFNASFDRSAKDWTVLRGAGAPDSAILHNNHKSLRVEPAGNSDAVVRSAPVTLSIGKRYEVSGWVRTENLTVRDLDRSPIATGAALSMASLPFDMRSESLGGTRDWTRLSLRFIATRAEDSILLTAGDGGALSGKSWFEGVSIDEVSRNDEWPARAAVKTYGPAYRYPAGGWIYLHIEGQPYERGFQHGFLMSKEVVQYLERCAADLDGRSHDQTWTYARTTANALFLRGFDQEILEEMKGIADGANSAGAEFMGRKLDLIDIVTANTEVELGELRAALPMTPTGLEGLHLQSPKYADQHRDVPITARCSAFAATGRATRDGKMVIAHVTMWPLTLAEQTNVMLDIKPAAGHRVLMQSYPGGIESGTDWYQNDAGVVLTETTIRQSPFNRDGTPVAYRARKAIQYGDNVDKVVQYLTEKNNGLYTNEWLIGDAKNDEIAMYEMGTYKTRLYRSSKNDWFGGAEGFYWGCNNAKDLQVRLEYAPDPKGAPEYLPYVPASRDLKWQELYRQYNGKIDEQFAFLAFRTAPLVSSTTMDAKVATSAMASRMLVWAAFGKPNQREWVPSKWQKENYAKNDGLYPSGYRLFAAEPAPSLRASIAENENARLSAKPEPPPPANPKGLDESRLWKGWLLPASDADIWFTAGSAAYYEDLKSDHLANAIAARQAALRSAAIADPTPITRFIQEEDKGALFLDALRRKLGDDRFLALMTSFYDAHSTKTVTAQEFLDTAGVQFTPPEEKAGPLYTASQIYSRLASAIIVYGTVSDAGANRYAAEQLQLHWLDAFESAVPIRKDFEVTPDELRAHDVVFVGRPESNSALAAWKQPLGLEAEGALFRVAGQDHASENEALVLAASNPLDAKRMVVVLAGNDALQTVRLSSARLPRVEYAIYDAGKQTSAGFR